MDYKDETLKEIQNGKEISLTKKNLQRTTKGAIKDKTKLFTKKQRNSTLKLQELKDN